MFSLDKILLEFVGANWMSLYVLITLLKGVALMTSGTKDDKIVTLLSNMFKTLRGGRVPDTIKPIETPATTEARLKETPQTSDTIR